MAEDPTYESVCIILAGLTLVLDRLHVDINPKTHKHIIVPIRTMQWEDQLPKWKPPDKAIEVTTYDESLNQCVLCVPIYHQ
jgi:hypothetical protein